MGSYDIDQKVMRPSYPYYMGPCSDKIVSLCIDGPWFSFTVFHKLFSSFSIDSEMPTYHI